MDDRTRQAARLWTLAQPVVSAFVASIVRDFSARDDVLQETAVAVLESFERYDAARPFTGWALGVARNQIGLYLRRQRRDRLVFDEPALDRLVAAFEETAAADSGELRHLDDCLGKLEGRARRICDLRYRDDRKPAAIAEVLGMNANAVAKALQRIRDQLRECLRRKASLEGAAP